MSYFKNVYKARYILVSLVERDIKNKYRRTILGISWSLITPLGLVAIIGGVFSVIFGQQLEVFIPYLFSGLIPWLYIVGCAQGGTNAYLSAQGYIKQTSTPIEIFPIRVALVEYVNMLFGILAFFMINLVLIPTNFSYKMFLILPILVLWMLLGMSISTISGIINTYFRDYALIQSLILQGLFYITPIIWLPEALEVKGYSFVYVVNPLYYMIELTRSVLIGQNMAGILFWINSIIFTSLFIMIAVFLSNKVGRKITFRL